MSNSRQQSQRRPIKLFIMLIFSSGVGANIMGQEARDSVRVVDLSEAVVLGVSFQETDPSQSPKSSTVLNGAEWLGAASVSEALEFIPGLDVRSRGAWGVQTDVSIRGGSYEQTALRVDGVRWSAPHTGHHLMNIPIDPEDLGHAEVVKSGAGPWAGVGAFAGSILMNSRPLKKGHAASFTAELGTYDWQRLRAHADFSTGSVNQAVSLSRASTSGHVPNSDAVINRLFYTISGGEPAAHWKGFVAAESKAFGAQNFYTSVYPDQFEATDIIVGQFNLNKEQGRLSISSAVHARFHQDRFELFREGTDWYQFTPDSFYVRPASLLSSYSLPDTAGLYAPGMSWYPGANEHQSGVCAVNGLVQWSGDQVVWTAAADVRTEQIRSNRLGTVGDQDNTRYPLGDGRQNVDAYASGKYENTSRRFQAEGTMGINGNSRFGWFGLPALSASWAWDESQSGRLFASAGRSVRHPSFTDLYYNIGGAIGSENLQPEEATQGEVGMRWSVEAGRSGRVMMETTRFIRKGKNLIDWIRLDGSDVFEAKNLEAIDFSGGDVTIDFSRTDASPKFQLLNARLSATWLDASRNAEGFTSSYVLDYMRAKYDAVLHFGQDGPLTAIIRGSMQNRNQTVVFENENELLQLWGAEVRYADHDGSGLHWTAHMRIDNAFDAQYADQGIVIQPGRMMRFGVTFEWIK